VTLTWSVGTVIVDFTISNSRLTYPDHCRTKDPDRKNSRTSPADPKHFSSLVKYSLVFESKLLSKRIPSRIKKGDKFYPLRGREPKPKIDPKGRITTAKKINPSMSTSMGF